jgi:hypothetical protein
MVERDVTCSGCGDKVEFSSKEPPCKMLEGWLMLSHWKGLGSVEQYHFCSLTCLKKWAGAQTPKIPKVFLESFTDEEGEGDTSL